jgi:hypothetical protein
MTINAKKSYCIRIGKRYDIKCASIVTNNGACLPWATSIRYLGITIVQSRPFKCCLRSNKTGFYKSVNAVLGKIYGIASEETILQLIFSKCIPVLLYGLESYHLNKSDNNSLDFTFNRFLMKLFKTSNINFINESRNYFNIMLPSDLLRKRRMKFIDNYECTSNWLCKYFRL